MTTKRWRSYDGFNQARSEEVPTMGQNTGASTGRASVVYESTSSAGASPVRTSPSPESVQGSPGSGADSSSSSCGSLTLWSSPEDGSSLRTYPDSSPRMEALTSGSYSRRWPTSGFTTSPGELWTADTSECPSGGGAYSSLRDVLEADAPSRFYLSPRAAEGILRRADRRGRDLPEELDTALRTLSTPSKGDQTSRTPRPTSSSLVRRLTPTECERLQGFPDGWTILP